MGSKKEKNIFDILRVTERDRFKTVEELFIRSQPNSVYYTLLILSSFIITAGLLLANTPIVIGGMLVAPVLTPILVAALAVVVRDYGTMARELLLIAKSAVILVLIAFILSLFFEPPAEIVVFNAVMQSVLLYFIVALASGIAATFAWVHKEVFDALPGIAIAVALVPPLSLIGVDLAMFNLDAARFNFALFLFNIIGIFIGSLVVFILLQFSTVEKKIHQEAKDVL